MSHELAPGVIDPPANVQPTPVAVIEPVPLIPQDSSHETPTNVVVPINTPPLTYLTPPPRAHGTFWRNFASILALALIACAAVAPGWLKDRVFVRTDFLKASATWKTPGQEFIAADAQQVEHASRVVPATLYAKERYHAGQLPLWNPYDGLGDSLLANGQSALFYPTALLHQLLPETWSWTISAALRLFSAGLGMWLLAGHYGLRRAPRLLPAIAFMLCGFNIAYLNHPRMNILPLLPWAVLSVELLIRRVTLLRFIAGGIIFALQFLGGDSAASLYLLFTCVLILLGRLFVVPSESLAIPVGQRLAGGIAVLGVICFGFALAAAQCLPTIEYAMGIAPHTNLQPANQPQSFAAPRFLIGSLFPYAAGFDPDQNAPEELGGAGRLNATEVAGGFIGTIPICLAIIGLLFSKRRETVWLWTLIALLALIFSLKFAPIEILFQKIPGLAFVSDRAPIGVFSLAITLLAGFGLETLIAWKRENIETPRLTRILKWSALTLATCAIIGAITIWAAKGPIVRRGDALVAAAQKNGALTANPADQFHAWIESNHRQLILTSARLLIPAGVLAGAWFILRKNKTRLIAPGILLLAIADLLAFAIPFNPGAAAETYPGRAASITAAAPNQPDPDTLRFAGPQSTSRMARSNAVAIAENRPRAWVVPKAIGWPGSGKSLDRAALTDINPEEVVLIDVEPPNSAAAGFQNSATPTPVQSIPAKKPEDDRPEVVRMHVISPGSGWLVLADAFTPGWTATIVNESSGFGRDEKIYPAFGSIRAMPLANTTRGASYTVEMRYRPLTWRIGVMTSSMAGVVMLILIGALMFRRARRPNESL